MNRKDILELKRRLKKDDCTFTRLCGCYVDANRSKVVTFGETFLNLEDEEFYKYLEIAKKTLSGALANNLLEFEFPLEEESPGGRQQFLMALRGSALKNDDLLERLYDLIIDNYAYPGNYLILVFHDAYDVMTRTMDNDKLDESEEVYEYLLCAVCPVVLSKPGLGYREDENRIGPRIRDWIVSLPETGFLFPAFTDRSSDIHSVLCYHKNPKEPHSEFVEGVFGCASKRTAAEKKQAFETIVKNAFGGDEDASREGFYDIQEGLLEVAENQADEDGEPVMLTPKAIGEIMEERNIPKPAAVLIEESFSKEFQDEIPELNHILDEKAAEAGSKIKEEKELRQKVQVLEQQLEDTKILTPINTGEDEEEAPTGDIKTYDIILRVKPEKASQIKSQLIDGQKCLVIPMEENEHAAINGINTTV
ncbi:MAG: DUF4317 domain-containing protein [Lachnospiraceae bacterium]|nr:DUF4317 domain-containing protein [Lachnospiraceae bacterium]MCM1256228.1 DUF4317 domain-containing protein [Roseburia sp.]